ncbi:MAG TPA: DUF4860 domain-containing protein [Oscillospiraceae bacterium]|nr:DUF4860 domain-containing protein [Oscillospiraceae bacterium]HNY00200.1 DUF4860 domain-containing protein [Oscillospiraceae bacterium]HPS75549.1 DUF4860 domain-containing protein [Oscillospiraceae bacterium]
MESRARATGNLIWILLFFAFAACVAATLLQGAVIYKNVSGVVDEEFGVHTALNYVQSRVRAGDIRGCVAVGEFDGCSALYCLEDSDDGGYATVIYCYGGALRELYYERGLDFTADAGEVLLKLDGADFADAGGGLIRFTCTDRGRTGSILLSTRTEGGAA